jgi:hypothetical protein
MDILFLPCTQADLLIEMESCLLWILFLNEIFSFLHGVIECLNAIVWYILCEYEHALYYDYQVTL